LRLTPRELATGTVAGVLASGVSSAFVLTFTKDASDGQRVTLLVGATLLLVVLAIPIARRFITGPLVNYVRPRVEGEIYSLAEAAIAQATKEAYGLARSYGSFGECEEEIRAQIAKSRRIDIFVQIGKTVLSGGNDFYKYLQYARVREEAQVRILHADISSAYLSERVAAERGSDLAQWRDDLRNAFNKATTLRMNSERRVQTRQHQEGFVWRLFIFDDTAFAQPYLFPSGNSDKAPVLRFDRLGNDGSANERSLYKTFAKYFELTWDDCAPQSLSLVELVGVDTSISAAAIIRHAGRYAFVIPQRYLASPQGEMYFHFPGGKIDPGEGLEAGLRREVREETAAEVRVLSGTGMTRYVTSSSERPRLTLIDTPTPTVIYKRSRRGDPNLEDPDVHWLVGYSAEVLAGSLEPHAEVAVILELASPDLERALEGTLTVGDVQRSAHGSRMSIRSDVKLDSAALLVPSGLAAVVASESHFTA
jgi:8-oxo-dGTP pyrophosphatase MutT (NUDIX family)